MALDTSNWTREDLVREAKLQTDAIQRLNVWLRLGYSLVAAGSIMAFLGGFMKALWKLLYATGVCAGVMLMVVFARNLPLTRLLLIIVSLIVVGNALTVFADGYAVMVASRFLSGLPHGA